MLFVDLIIRGRMVCLADKSISKWSATEHADLTLARTMSFAAARPLKNLSEFVFCDHSLELHEQFILGCRTAWRAYKHGLDAGAGKLLD